MIHSIRIQNCRPCSTSQTKPWQQVETIVISITKRQEICTYYRPKTGYPVQHNILSATVIANNCATADAFATSFMVLGMDGTKKILEQHPELLAYLIYSDAQGKNRVWYSPSMKKILAE